MRLVARAFGFFPAIVAIAVFLAALAAPRVARADGADDAKQKGDEAMVALHYQEALEWYQRAFEVSKNTALLYNMGRAYEGLADFPHALDALEEFDTKAPPELKARVPKLQELLQDLRGRIATVVVSSPVEGAEIRLGERVVGATKAGQVVLRVNAGKQHLVVQREGYIPFERDLTLVGGKLETIDATLAQRATSGVLRVTSPVVGAAVRLDGHPFGTVPAEAPLAAGSHVVTLERDGYEPARANVVLVAGERKDVEIPMAKRASILATWWFWTAVGVVAAGGVATVIALTSSRSPDTGTIAPGQVKAELRF
jgi:hypothetical protein